MAISRSRRKPPARTRDMPLPRAETEPDGRRRRRSPIPCRRSRDGGKGSKESECDSLSDCSGSDDSMRDSKRRRRHRRKGSERGRSKGGRRYRRRSHMGSDSDESRDRSRKRSRSQKGPKETERRSSRKKKKNRRDGSTRKEGNEDARLKETIEVRSALEDGNDGADEAVAPLVGPMLPPPRVEAQVVGYGGALRPGEGDTMAQFVQQGKRIPRRGEVGLSAEEIRWFEEAGYVMSRSRHARITAVRLRKENQVYSAEDKRSLAAFNLEQTARRESNVRDDLRRLVDRTLGKLAGSDHDDDLLSAR